MAEKEELPPPAMEEIAALGKKLLVLMQHNAFHNAGVTPLMTDAVQQMVDLAEGKPGKPLSTE